MPKQESIIKIRGKMDNQSYYYTRNGGYQVRKINPTMSERVKTEEAFVNTRKNATEFGAAALSANQMIGAISTRWRYLLKPNIGGYMTKFIYDLMKRDTTSPWGQRQVQEADIALIQQEYNKMSKNPMPDFITEIIFSGLFYDSTPNIKSIYTIGAYDTDANFEQDLMSKGADAVRLVFYNFASGVPKYSDGAYVVLSPRIYTFSIYDTNMVRLTGEGGHLLVNQFVNPYEIAPTNAEGHCGGVLAVLFPLKLVGGTSMTPRENVLQHLVSAYWCPLTERAMTSS